MASAKNEAKIRFTADTSDFNKQIKSADSAMRELRSELRLNATRMKSSGASVEALTESKRILEAQEQALAQKVDALSGKLEAAQSIWGENSTEAQRYATQLNNARAQQENVRAAIEQANQAIEDQTRAESDARSAYGRLTAEISQQRSHVDQLERAYADAVLTYGENSRECQELRTELSRASAELRESESRMDRAERSARDLARGLDDAGDSADDAGISFGELAGADFVSDVAQDLIGTLMGLSEETDEYRTSMTQLNNTFEWSGRSADEAREVYQNFLGLLGDSDEAVEAAQDMNNLADTGADIDTWYSIAAGTVSAFGQALPVTSLVESANESIRCGQVVGGLADALNWTSINAEVLNTRLGSEHPAAMGAFNAALAEGMSNEDAMNAALAACSDEQERQQLVTAVLASQYSELGDGYLDATSDIDEARRASDDLKQAQADLAERITPLRTLVTEFAANGLGFLNENMSGVVSVVMALATAFVVLKGAMLMQGAANQLASLLNFVKMGIGGLSPPILVVAAALAALVGIFTWAYQEVEPFRAAIDQLVLTFQQTFGPMIQQLMTYLGSVMQQAMPMLASFLTTYVVPAIQQFADFLVTTVFPALQQFANWFTVNILPVLQQLWNFVLTNILPLLQQFADFIVTTVVPALGNLWSWFSANILPVLQQIWSFFVANILPILGQFASFVLGTVVPALGDLWTWFSNNILPVLSDVWSFISSNILPVFSSLAGFVTGTVVPALQSLWSWFSNNILPIVQDVGDKVKWLGDRFGEVADFIGGLKIEFPKFKLPHLKFSGDFSLIPPRVPSFWVEWYAKGAVLNKPTIFGSNGGNPMVGGEAGPEAVAPISVLQGYVADAVAAADSRGADMICDAIERLADRVTVLEVNGREIATAIAGDSDRVAGRRQNLATRGLAL